MSEGSKELPQGWVVSSMSELGHFERGIGFPRTARRDIASVETISCLRTANVQDTIQFNDVWEVDKQYLKKSDKLLRENDIIFSVSNSLKLVGKSAIAKNVKKEYTFGAFLAAFRCDCQILPEYLQYFLTSLTARNWIRQNASTTTNISNIGVKALGLLRLPRPPLAEQSRIVDKIDELFSSIEAGERAIARARTALTRYRKAVLKAAVTGDLTADWRKENPPTETAEALLKRILKARYAAWEKAELEKLDAKGKARPETEKQWEKFRGKYKEPVGSNAATLSELPKNWLGVTVDQISEFITSGSRGWAKYYSEEGPLFVRVGNFNRSSIELDFKKLQCVSPPAGAEGARTKLQLNDLLVSITADVGMVAIFRGQYEDAYINQHVALVRTPSIVNEEWLAWAIVNPTKQQEILGTGRGATKDGLTLSDLRELRIPFPPANEQIEIVNRVEQALSKADAVEATLNAQSRQAKALKQAVLKTAFEGRLVPQNPKDEPASELLKRIKEQT